MPKNTDEEGQNEVNTPQETKNIENFDDQKSPENGRKELKSLKFDPNVKNEDNSIPLEDKVSPRNINPNWQKGQKEFDTLKRSRPEEDYKYEPEIAKSVSNIAAVDAKSV